MEKHSSLFDPSVIDEVNSYTITAPGGQSSDVEEEAGRRFSDVRDGQRVRQVRGGRAEDPAETVRHLFLVLEWPAGSGFVEHLRQT